MTHVLEAFPVPFFALLPWWWPRFIFALSTVGLNAAINFTGNFGHLGIITMVECIPVMDDEVYTDHFLLLPHQYLLRFRHADMLTQTFAFFLPRGLVDRPVSPWSLSAVIAMILSFLPFSMYFIASTLSLLDVYDRYGKYEQFVPGWMKVLVGVRKTCLKLIRASRLIHGIIVAACARGILNFPT